MDLYLPPKPAIIIPKPKELITLPAGFTMTPMAGFGGKRRGRVLATGSAFDTASATTYSFGPGAMTPEHDVVIIGAIGAGSNRTVSSMTATFDVSGAVAMTLIHAMASANPVGTLAIVENPNPLNTTVTIDVVFSGSNSRCCVTSFYCSDIDHQSAHASETTTTEPFTGTIDTPDDGIGIAMTYDNNSATPTVSWTTYTEAVEREITSTGRVFSAAYIEGSNDDSYSADYSATSGGLMVGASFRGRIS